jgi:hypothetical protein
MRLVVGDVVVRIGGTVRPEPEPEKELARIGEVLGAEEFAEWTREYRAGRWRLACMEMFADVVSDEGVTRFCDGGVRPLTLGVPHGEDNIRHAREAVAQYLDDLAAALNDNGVDIAATELGRLPVVIELDPDMETQLSV